MLGELENLLRSAGLVIVASYGYMYSFVSIGFRNLHTLDERMALPIWLTPKLQRRVESIWRYLEGQRWYYRWLGCIGVIAEKQEEKS
jgi:hypothetical protein